MSTRNNLAYAERQLRYFTKVVDKLRLTSDASDAKEEEKRKETFPPAPPIEKSEKEKENDHNNNRARARVGACRSHVPTVEEVAAFAKEIGSDIDPNYFWRYYNSNHHKWPSEWRDRLRNWTVNGNSRGRIVINEPQKAPPKPKAFDWTLCAERCAHCEGSRCSCDIKTPPSDETPPRPPQECKHFKPLA